jgi:hypothetical protein
MWVDPLSRSVTPGPPSRPSAMRQAGEVCSWEPNGIYRKVTSRVQVTTIDIDVENTIRGR